MLPRCSIILPARNEGSSVIRVLERIDEVAEFPYECVVVVDFENDTTIESLVSLRLSKGEIRIVVNKFGPGPANAIKWGIQNSEANVVVITMADGSDDPSDIPALVRLVERGVVIACGSRYAPGGQQIGSKRLKGTLSRLAGKSYRLITGVGTYDATNNFKAYSREFLQSIEIESEKGFEIGLELVAKATKLKLPIGEIPTIWLERSQGFSNFRILAWMPEYLKWYFYGIGVGKNKSK